MTNQRWSLALLTLGVLLGVVPRAHGFSLIQNKSPKVVSPSHPENLPGRRAILQTMGVVAATILVPNQAAHASGGATAGGVYLQSAKQRYNERVSAGAKSFVALGPQLDNGDLNGVKAFFSEETVGTWKDFSAAGYLLANAFRRSSSTAPDSLPSVKKWKAYTASVQEMTKALKKKDVKGVQQSYNTALSALDEYLEKVELPPYKEM